MDDQSQVARLLRSVEEWNAWRKENPEEEIDLTGVDLEGRRVQGIELSDARLCKANLKWTLLTDANCRNADLRMATLRNGYARNAVFDEARFEGVGPQVDFSGSSFRQAEFDACDLAEANFFLADLTGATFNRCNLMRSDLRRSRITNGILTGCSLQEASFLGTVVDGAVFDGCVFSGTAMTALDLSSVRRLETNRHAGPSDVMGCLATTAQGLLARPQNKQRVEEFLRKAGVAEVYLEAFSAAVNSPEQFYSCFISYSHSDKACARRLHDALQGRGIRCWLDEKDMVPGSRILDAVDDAIRLNDKLLICCSEASLNSWWVKDEIRKAQERERSDTRDILIPLDLDGYLLHGWTDGLASDLRSRLAADFTGWEQDNAKFAEQFERVVKALKLDREEEAEGRL